MHKSQATIKTQNASKYLQQLAKHWAHKIPDLTYDQTQAHIPFGEGVLLELVANSEVLTVQITAPDAETATRSQEVFDRHIVRFAFRETLEINWQQL